jgi:heme/copper-type cytochrome/quinol oxidase subunit 2
LGRTFLAPNTSTSLHTTLAAAAHPAEGQFLHEEQTLNKAKSLMMMMIMMIMIIIIVIIIIIIIEQSL